MVLRIGNADKTVRGNRKGVSDKNKTTLNYKETAETDRNKNDWSYNNS